LADPADTEQGLARAPDGPREAQRLEHARDQRLGDEFGVRREPGVRGVLGTGGWTGGSGSRSKRTPKSSAPETPSTVEWCMVAMSASFPFSRPSTIHISHSGW